MNNFKDIVKLLRPEQWIKNMFVFGAIIFSNNFRNTTLIKNNILTFIAICLISSTVYIINDIIDLHRDRKHTVKCKRPIASGRVSIFKAIGIAVILASSSLLLSINLDKYIFIIILLYFFNNILYTFKVKRIVIMDVFSIAIGFILRVVSGGIATGVQSSSWILLCTLFLSLFLGFGKRRNEIITLGEDAIKHRENLSQYTEKLLDQLINIVLTCTIIFYSIYCILGSSSRKFILTTIFVIFGVLRYYYLIYSKGEGGNPTELVLKDKQILCCVLLWTFNCFFILSE